MSSKNTSGLRHRLSLTAQTWQATTAVLMFLVLALVITFAPVPYLVWTPGGSYDIAESAVVSGKKVPVVNTGKLSAGALNGHLLVLTVSQSRTDSLVTLPEALLAHWMDHRDVLPRSILVPPGKTEEELARDEQVLMSDSQRNAVIAALQSAQKPIIHRVQVVSIAATGPARDKLKVGDFIIQIDGQNVTIPSDIDNNLTNVKKRVPGQTINVQILRDGKKMGVDITLAAAHNEKKGPTLGIRADVGYDLTDTEIVLSLDPGIGGSSAGLSFALGVYDSVSKVDVLKGRTIAATGDIDSSGAVTGIGGIQEKAAAAEAGGATILIIPKTNCADLAGTRTSLRVIPVGNLNEAVSALENVDDPAKANTVPSCS